MIDREKWYCSRDGGNWMDLFYILMDLLELLINCICDVRERKELRIVLSVWFEYLGEFWCYLVGREIVGR